MKIWCCSLNFSHPAAITLIVIATLIPLGSIQAGGATPVQTPANTETRCPGPFSGIWFLYTNEMHYTCECPSGKKKTYTESNIWEANPYVCQTGNNLTGIEDHGPGYWFIHLNGTVTNFNARFQVARSPHPGDPNADCSHDTFQQEGIVFGREIRGTVTSTRQDDSSSCYASYCQEWGKSKCTGTGTFGGYVGNGGVQQPSVTDVSQSSGIANQNVATTGVQWVDYNGDKRLDLFLVGSNGTALFKNVGRGKFQNVTVQARITNNGRAANGASWADIDNDGDLDVFIANATGPATLLLNNHGVFQDISNKLQQTGGAGLEDSGISRAGIWVDINNDRDIDLLVVKDGGPNQLFLKKGLEFTNIASSAGLAAVSTGRSAVAFDVNQDGFEDLYVVNFGHPNKLYLNNKNKTFSDISASAGVGFTGGSVQAATDDYDRDKDADLFVVNNTGSSILYKNLGNSKFAIATPAPLKSPKKGIAAAFVDIDQDGNADLVLAQTVGGNKLFQNMGNGEFSVVKNVDLSNPHNPTGITIGDFNGDGLPDIAIGDGGTTQEHGDSLYQNTGGGGTNFLQLTLVGTSSNRAAIGARVIVQTGLTYQAKEVSSGNGQSQESLPLDFGLGVAELVDTIQIYWPGGAVQTLTNVNANQKLTVTQSN